MQASYNKCHKNETPTKWAGDHEKLLYRRVKKCLYQLAIRREKKLVSGYYKGTMEMEDGNPPLWGKMQQE